MRMSLLAVIPLLVIPAELRSQADMYDGKPTFAEGTDLAYYVWRDGNSWHLRWTTQGAARRFTGSVNSDGGKLKSLKRIDVEKETKVLSRLDCADEENEVVLDAELFAKFNDLLVFPPPKRRAGRFRRYRDFCLRNSELFAHLVPDAVTWRNDPGGSFGHQRQTPARTPHQMRFVRFRAQE